MANQVKFKEISFAVGDQVKVYQRIIEGEKERITPFQGVVIGVRGAGENKTFTVRRIAAGNIGTERIWPLNSPWITKIEVLKKGKVKRAKLYYLRKKVGRKAIRIKAKDDRVGRDEKKKPRRTRRKSRPPTSKK